MSKNYWEIKVPEEGDLTREQGWAELSRCATKLTTVLGRLNALYPSEENPSPLSSSERDDLASVRQRLLRANKHLSMDVLDRLAAIAADDKRKEKTPYYTAIDRFPKAIRDMVADYYCDVYRFKNKGGNPAVLAFAILEEYCDFEPSDIGEIVKKYMSPDQSYHEVWTCPQCDDYGLGEVAGKPCKRCLGWGYVFGKKPADDEYDWSEKGREALNEGREWTAEMEKAEQARLQAEWEAA